MILHLEDWSKQNAEPDFSTTNRSALELVSLLKTMNIKNCFFFLALHDQTLKGVNPHSQSLSQEMKARIILECKLNPWYFFREVAKVPAGSGAEPEQLRFNRANVCMWWLYYNHITNIQIQPRQTGKSLCADMLQVEQLNFRCKNTQHNLFTKDEKLRKENIERIKNIMEALPRWADMRTKKDANNIEFVTINALGNKLNTHLPRASARDAEKVGRGFTSPTNFYDELPFQTWAELAYPASISSMDAAIERAARAGVDYGVVITTTAGKKDDRDGKFVYRLCMQACRWDERLYDAGNQEELERVVRRNSSDGTATVYSCFNHRQLGFTDEWVVEKMRKSKGGPDAAERDYLCKWTSGTATSPFTPKQADAIRASSRDIEHMEITPEGYVLRWYYPEDRIKYEMENGKHIIGLDTSDASGGDDIGFYMINTRTLKVACTAKINETNIITFAQWLSNFMTNYKGTILVPERRSTGGSICDFLLKILPSRGEDPFKRIYNMVVHDSDLDRNRYEDMRSSGKTGDALIRYRKLFGYATSASGANSRSRLYSDTLWNILRKLDCKFGDKDVIDQLLGLEYRNNRIDHGDGKHDDLVIAMLLSYWFLLYGKNFTYYGLMPNEIMTDMEDHSNLSQSERMQQAEQKQYRDELNALAEAYANEREEIAARRIEMKMRMLEKKLIMEAGEINTVDELIRKLKEEKHKNNGNRRSYFDQRVSHSINTGPGGLITATETSGYYTPPRRYPFR